VSVWKTRRWRWHSEQFPSFQRLQDQTDLLGFVGGTVDTVNVGSRAPTCPFFNMVLCERVSIITRMTGAPDQGA
jgi:hypothetical protein